MAFLLVVGGRRGKNVFCIRYFINFVDIYDVVYGVLNFVGSGILEFFLGFRVKVVLVLYVYCFFGVFALYYFCGLRLCVVFGWFDRESKKKKDLVGG